MTRNSLVFISIQRVYIQLHKIDIFVPIDTDIIEECNTELEPEDQCAVYKRKANHLKLRKEGKSMRGIAQTLGITDTTICNVLTKKETTDTVWVGQGK